MVDISFIEKLKILFNFIKDNSFNSLIILLIGVIIIDLLYGKNKKETKILYLITILLLIIYTLFNNYKSFINIIDIYITNIFKLAYFPSIIDYITFIIITILIQIISIKKSNKVIKNINIWVGIIIEVLFIFNIIALNGININLNNITSIYENNLLLCIFQLTGVLFIIWVIFNIIILIINKILDKKIDMPKLNNNY